MARDSNAAVLRRWRADPLAFLGDVLTREDGSSYGRGLDDWQREDFRAAFAAHGRHLWWERPRGHSKTLDAAALALYHLLTGASRRVYFAAVDADQAAIAFDSLRGFVQRSPLLAGAVRLNKREVVVPSTDSDLRVLPADAPGSWGLRPSLVVADELHAWRTQAAQEFFDALVSSLGKVQGARMLVTTTAGWDRASLCWRLREQIQGDDAWLYSWRGQCASWVSADFLDGQRRLLPAHVYRMLHDNLWSDAGGAFLTGAEVDACFDSAMEPAAHGTAGRHWLGLDLGLSRDASVAAVVHWDAERGVMVDAIGSWSGSRQDRVQLEDVEAWVMAARERFPSLTVRADPWQAVGLVQRLQARGVRCDEVAFSAQFRGRLFGTLMDLVRSARLRCFPHDDLRAELLRLEFREVGGQLRVDHPAGGHDDHAVAVGLAAMAAAEFGARPMQAHAPIGVGLNSRWAGHAGWGAGGRRWGR